MSWGVYGRRETARISIGTRRIEAYRAGMDQHPDTWTSEGVKGGLELVDPPGDPPHWWPQKRTPSTPLGL